MTAPVCLRCGRPVVAELVLVVDQLGNPHHVDCILRLARSAHISKARKPRRTS